MESKCRAIWTIGISSKNIQSNWENLQRKCLSSASQIDFRTGCGKSTNHVKYRQFSAALGESVSLAWFEKLEAVFNDSYVTWQATFWM